MGGKRKNPNCVRCNVLKTSENAYVYKDGRHGSYCKSCEIQNSKENRKKWSDMAKRNTTKTWNKTNWNHYPDPDWVWTQIENGNIGAKLYEKMDKKYELKAHGNTGIKQNRTPKKK